MQLNTLEKKSRNILIQVAQGKLDTHFPRLITYKEFWELISDKKWGRGQRSKVVQIITRISAADILNGAPPLNELVVVKKTGLPGEEWPSIRGYIKKLSKSKPPYKNHKEAQQACWEYWGAEGNKNCTDKEAEEGLATDKTVKFRSRNRALVAERKKKDKNACQACGYKQRVNGKYIIDVHHKYPLSSGDAVRVTSINDLICLCPNCHRIAHTMKFPLSLAKIKNVVNKSS
ncbi:MAG: hypothetical protein GQ470_04050 [Gammaproteobacteria bacterium]|nr:hypothetical protein [Gammaproteobacteria bacterium]